MVAGGAILVCGPEVEIKAGVEMVAEASSVIAVGGGEGEVCVGGEGGIVCGEAVGEFSPEARGGRRGICG